MAGSVGMAKKQGCSSTPAPTDLSSILVIIDASVADTATLLAGVVPGAIAVLLDSQRDGVEQITEALQQHPEIDSLHIVSHGAPGTLFLGNTQLSLQTLELYSWDLQAWSASSILLYGCNVAAGDAGAEFIEQLHALTGAAIAASKNLTGNKALGGDWQLEVSTHTLAHPLPFEQAVMESYKGVLADLISGLGGSAGFGENTAPVVDDTFVEIDITPVFANGINFFGTTYTRAFLSTNGNITFGSGSSSFTPTAITGNTGRPIIAAFFDDIDVRKTNAGQTPSGTSTGSNRIYWDLDSTNRVVTFTWDDVAPYSGGASSNAFQIRLIDQGNGDFDIELRYESINWNLRNAVAGWSAGNGTAYFQLPQSGNATAMLNLENETNNGTPGVFSFPVRGGKIGNTDPTISEIVNQRTLEATATAPIAFTIGDAETAADSLTISATSSNSSLIPDANIILGGAGANRTITLTPTTQTGLTTITLTVSDGTATTTETFDVLVEPAEPTGIPTQVIIVQPGQDRGVQHQGTRRAEVIRGSWGSDTLYGSGGNDRIISGFRQSSMGQDRLFGGDGNDQLFAGGGRDYLDGGNGDDLLDGGNGRDMLLGGAGSDRLLGGNGNDILVGGTGNDTLRGGRGRDMFTFNALDEGVDTIADFKTEDVIDLRQIFAQSAFSGATSFVQFSQFVQLVQVGANTEVRVDADGSGSGTDFTMLATLQNVAANTMTPRNFVIR
ncbi:MAG: DUF4347 domain-containing protein [Oculatellaceae cyanobacterium bins.114]|nr:DUF4347 domain-containing protein [Oculatellaceae cyanobacterium bins.114]